NIPLHLQAKLLTVLEQRQVLPVGSNQATPIDVRVLSATNVPRDELADESRFRQDLLFRLNTVELTLPPLRDRAEDIVAIAEHYAEIYARKYQKQKLAFSSEALHALRSDPWPGNVRALRHAVERAVILAANGRYEPEDLQLRSAAIPRVQDGSGSIPNSSAEPLPADLNLENLERRAVETALKRHRYNISHAAKELGLTRAALYRRMEKYGF
ncbi:MAG: sigma 54-interacting transcriptional regulator, partial [Pseudomonadota bacterium]